MRYSTEELCLIKECLSLGNTYNEISDFILEDFNIIRTVEALYTKANLMGWHNRVRKTIDELKSEVYLINTDIKILETYYKNNHTKIKVQCLLDGCIWYVTSNKLLMGRGCPVCANNIKKTIKQFKYELNIINTDIEVLSEEYTNNHTKIKVQCLLDGYIWNTKPNDLLSGKGCAMCAYRNSLGGYGNMNKKKADTLGYPLYLYHVKLQFEGEVFYKYGLTKNKDRRRFKNYSPYKTVEELSFIKYDAWTAICKERNLKSNYTPKYKFGGWTECYI